MGFRRPKKNQHVEGRPILTLTHGSPSFLGVALLFGGLKREK